MRIIFYLLVIGVSAVVTFGFAVLIYRLSHRFRLYPKIRERDVHTRPTPRLGGIAMFLGILAAFAVGSFLPQLDRRLVDVVDPDGQQEEPVTLPLEEPAHRRGGVVARDQVEVEALEVERGAPQPGEGEAVLSDGLALDAEQLLVPPGPVIEVADGDVDSVDLVPEHGEPFGACVAVVEDGDGVERG